MRCQTLYNTANNLTRIISRSGLRQSVNTIFSGVTKLLAYNRCTIISKLTLLKIAHYFLTTSFAFCRLLNLNRSFFDQRNIFWVVHFCRDVCINVFTVVGGNFGCDSCGNRFFDNSYCNSTRNHTNVRNVREHLSVCCILG